MWPRRIPRQGQLGEASRASQGWTVKLQDFHCKPTPLNTDLRVEARFVEQDGRKIHAWAGIYHGDVLTAEANGIFIEVRPKQMLAIAESNVDSADPRMIEAIRAEALREGAASDVQRPVEIPDPPPA